jgi:hypothetical protein
VSEPAKPWEPLWKTMPIYEEPDRNEPNDCQEEPDRDNPHDWE